MDMDDLPRPKPDRLGDVEKEDLDDYSREDLKERIARLQAEIARAEKALEAKGASQAAAEAFFKS